MSLNWYALRVKPQTELAAMAAVCGTGTWAFAPLQVNMIRVGMRRRPRTVTSPLLPGYVLAKLPHGHAARDVPLVKGVVCVAGEPAALPKADVLELLTPRVGTAAPALSRKARRLARHIRQLEARANVPTRRGFYVTNS